ncbi:jg11853 [Pararge aegeria aegeria]|uniref:Jg11853 protein n=1 Tax=Pararge aegeria aegeria TaxID=348720 RepID=A0A8S4SP23_9NEOP|nr:jg11853 [Pararge aegeria aegeria]
MLVSSLKVCTGTSSMGPIRSIRNDEIRRRTRVTDSSASRKAGVALRGHIEPIDVGVPRCQNATPHR